MKDFEYYLKNNLVKKISPDFERAKSLIYDAEERLRVNSLMTINEDFSKLIFENIYDVLRDLIDAILLREGYKSYSHEGSISFLAKKGFDIFEIERLDRFRYKRNGSKYYGEKIIQKDAEDIFEFYLKIKDKLNFILKDLK